MIVIAFAGSDQNNGFGEKSIFVINSKKKETGKMFSLIATIGTTAAIEWFTGGVLFGISAYSAAKETTK